jgi:hypothetical protein
MAANWHTGWFANVEVNDGHHCTAVIAFQMPNGSNGAQPATELM